MKLARTSRIFALTATTLLACSGSEDDPLMNEQDSGTTDGGLADGSTQTDPDGALGDDGGPNGSDAGDGGPPPDGFSVTVRSGGAPLPNVAVVFHDAAGLTIGDAITDNQGRVVRDPAPSAVTVATFASDYGDGWFPITFMDLAPDDDLVVDLPSSGALAEVGFFDVGALALAPNLGAAYYEVHAGDPSSGNCQAFQDLIDSPIADPLQVSLYDACVRETNAVLAYVYASNDTLLGYAYAPQSVAKPPANGSTPVSLGAFQPPSTTLIRGTPLDPNFNSGADLYLLARGGRFYSNLYSDSSGDLASGMGFPYPAGFADSFEVTAWTYGYVSEARITDVLGVRALRAPTGMLELDLDLPRVSSMAFDNADLARPTLHWALEKPLVGADAQLVVLRWGELINSDLYENYRWLFVTAPERDSLRVPELRVALAGPVPLPAPGPVITIAPNDEAYFDTITVIDDVDLTGHAAFKARPLAIDDGRGSALGEHPVRLDPSEARGTVRVTSAWNGD